MLQLATAGRLRQHRRSDAFHVTQNAFDHLLQIGLALTQVLVFHLVELPRDHLVLRGQRPLGVVVTIRNPALDTADQLLVLQQHEVHVQQRRQFSRRVTRQLSLQASDLVSDRIARGAYALNFRLNLAGIDKVMRHVGSAGGDQHGTANRNTA